MAEHERATAYGELIKALEAVVGEEHVVAGDAALPAGVDGVTPKVAVFPADAREIGAVVAYANEQRLAVLPIGGATQLGLGHPPERADIALFLSRLDRIVAHEPADMTVTVEAGISMAALQAHLAQYGQCLPYTRLCRAGPPSGASSPHARRDRCGRCFVASPTGSSASTWSPPRESWSKRAAGSLRT